MKIDRYIPQIVAAQKALGPIAPAKQAGEITGAYYEHDEKQRSATMTEKGVTFMEEILIAAGLLAEGSGLYDIENVSVVHHVQQALRAHVLFQRDTDYIVKDNKVVIIDEFTGRMMEGRRFSEGLHQALEAKEKVTIQNENQTLASITFQNYFRLFPKLAGMTGTAMTAELKKAKIPHQVLNARFHDQEALIISQAGRPGAVTIATNMAGRGTDIKLGGNDDMLIEAGGDPVAIRAQIEKDKEIVIAAGGLFVIGTERHESRRIDNQLRGRSGRQGDPGASKFFLSLQDDLMRIFGSERIDTALTRLGLKEDEAIFHPWMNKAIERAQTKVEQRNYEIRKTLLKYDDVMNDQRKVIYEQRLELMDFDDVHETIEDMRHDVNQALVSTHIPAGSYAEAWDAPGLSFELKRVYGLDLPVTDWAAQEGIADGEILERINEATAQHLLLKEADFPPDVFRIAEKRVLMETLDQLWKDHLLSLDHLRQGINLRAYAQRDPLNEYKQEAFGLFEHMLNHLREVVISRLSRLQIRMELTDEMMRNYKPQQEMHESRQDPALALPPGQPMVAQAQTLKMNVKPEDRVATDPASWGKVARNEACPCGSGKKFKHCHGTL